MRYVAAAFALTALIFATVGPRVPVLAAPAAADPLRVVEVPPPKPPTAVEFRCAAGEQLQLQSPRPSVWVVFDAGCQIRTPGNASPADTATFTATAKGVYRFLAISADGFVLGSVTVGTPDPGPGPGPGPAPADPLVRDIKAAFAEDGGRPADMKALAALFTLMVTEAGKPEYATAAALNKVYLAARDEMLNGALPAVRRRCGQEVAAVVGTDADAALTDATRAKLKALYARLAAAVGEASA